MFNLPFLCYDNNFCVIWSWIVIIWKFNKRGLIHHFGYDPTSLTWNEVSFHLYIKMQDKHVQHYLCSKHFYFIIGSLWNFTYLKNTGFNLCLINAKHSFNIVCQTIYAQKEIKRTFNLHSLWCNFHFSLLNKWYWSILKIFMYINDSLKKVNRFWIGWTVWLYESLYKYTA